MLVILVLTFACVGLLTTVIAFAVTVEWLLNLWNDHRAINTQFKKSSDRILNNER